MSYNVKIKHVSQAVDQVEGVLMDLRRAPRPTSTSSTPHDLAKLTATQTLYDVCV